LFVSATILVNKVEYIIYL